MNKILIVDDEVKILKAFVRLFMDTEFELLTASSGVEALELLTKDSVKIIISDMKMPYMDGYELLNIVKQLYPKTIRIILSGFSDEKTMFFAIKKNIARCYLLKPWRNEEIINLLTGILQIEDKLNRCNLFLPINNIENLATARRYYSHIQELLSEELPDMEKITSEIEKDIVITAKILSVINLDYQGAKTGSIKKAISFVGFKNLQEIVGKIQLFENVEPQSEIADIINKIWDQSYVATKLLHFLYETFLHQKLPEEYAAVCTLHSIGKVFLLNIYFEEYSKLLLKVKNEKRNLLELEREVFSVSHCEAGSYLLEWWGLPEFLVESACYYHDPFNEKIINKKLLCAVYIVTQYASKISGNEDTESFDLSAFDFLKISKSDFEEGISNFKC